MIEALAKVAEVATESAESSSGAEIDPDARVETEHSGGETSQNAEVDPDARIESDSGEKRGLTTEEKEQLKAETGWSDEIVGAISSMEEAQIYKDAGLVEAEIKTKTASL